MATRNIRRAAEPKRGVPAPDRERQAAAPTAEPIEEAESSTPKAAAPERTIQELVTALRLLSDETRLRILTYLMQAGELNVTEICKRLGQTQPAVSHHLALLRVAGLIEARRSGKNNFYSVRTDHLADLLAMLLSAAGVLPRKMRFHDFTLTYQGR